MVWCAHPCGGDGGACAAGVPHAQGVGTPPQGVGTGGRRGGGVGLWGDSGTGDERTRGDVDGSGQDKGGERGDKSEVME